MSSTDKALQTQLVNIETRTGKTLKQLFAVLRGGCGGAVGEWCVYGVGFRPECPGSWLGNRSVDGVMAGCDCG